MRVCSFDVNNLFLTLFLYWLGIALYPIHASIYVLPEKGRIIGEVQQATSEFNETLEEVGQRFDIGLYEMIRANPNVLAHHILTQGTRLLIPSIFHLPSVPRNGIVIDLAHYRLFYYPPDENVVITFPVGIGKKGWETPVGITKIIEKIPHPIWHPTSRILKAGRANGLELPDEFPSGPDNPLGDYALRLGWGSVLIHGSNQLKGVGTKVSAGCIRMLPDDIEYLFKNVKIGTKVRVL